ncbi:endopeptidase La [Treponema sp. OMZ 840]|uniref:endopeptidase La n=1 Tax=Treponema sp. OMZ 840 TaxID=244313 RepID=UPI003D8B3287
MAEQTIVPADQTLSNKLRLIPLSGRPIFPGIFTPLMINSAEDTKVIESAYTEDGLIGIVMLKSEAETPVVSDLHQVGTAARIIKKINLPDGGVNIFISTIKRFRIRKALSQKNPMAVVVEYLEDEEDATFEVKALTRALISEMKEISENNPLFSEEMRLNMVNIDHPGKIADFIASILNIDKDEQQKVLEMQNVRQRMESVLVFIKKEQELLRIQKKIQTELNDRIEKNQREYFLKEELKSIKEELGMTSDAKSSDFQKFEEKIAKFRFEGEIAETVTGELEKFSLMDPNSSEYIVTRNYLDTIVNLPWEEPVPENYGMSQARKTLDEDHYGLEDVKKRIVEYLAVRKLKNDSKGSILLLVGPPGVGKTSVCRSIARAMNKPFFRFSVGGMRDEAEIKGHRRTYIGAMPGKIIQGLKIVKTKAPVFVIDEVDKMGSSYQGDPSSALLEVLDPEQNVAFRDHYLDIPFDVSNILFMLTANSLDGIPEPLRDRAEIIHLSGYIDQEKIEIAKHFLVPKSLQKNGLAKNQVHYSKGDLLFIANSYAREAGVRNFEKNLDKIHRKYAAELLAEPEISSLMDRVYALKDASQKELEKRIEDQKAAEEKTREATKDVPDTGRKEKKPKELKRIISEEEKESQKKLNRLLSRPLTPGKVLIEHYLGKPVFTDEDNRKKADRPGTAIGLAWTSMGGDTLLLEALTIPGKEGFNLTGQMGDVMKESASIAMSWVRSYAIEHKIKDADFFENHKIHLHIPEGATPKDGPSAGITMTVVLLSLLKNKTIRKNLAMTGELSLTGQVLPIGGLKEKTVAARRNGIKHVIIPKQNMRDLDDIPEHVKKGISFYPVTHMEEVLALAF